MKHMKQFFFFWILVILSTTGFSATFKAGDTVLVSFPANNIKDDAYIIGIVEKVTAEGDYQITVRDYVQDHDYGLSCVPIAVNDKGQETDQSGWELWGDTKKLTNRGLQYVVPAEKVIKLNVGQMRFIDRYNVYITFSRWKDNAPVMPPEKLESTKQEAIAIEMEGMLPALDLAIKDRASYYDPANGRPYWSYETVPKLNQLLDHIIQTLDEDKELNQLWRAKKRDEVELNASMRTYFLVDAIDKSVDDAYDILWADEIEKTDPKALKRLKKKLKYLGKKIN